MAHSFTSLHFHIVYGTKNHAPMLTEGFVDRVYSYVIGLVQRRQCAVVAIGGTADHVHILLRMDQSRAVADVMREIKSVPSRWVRETFPEQRDFAWQEGYGAFAVSTPGLPRVKAYIAGQAEHHREVSFREEFLSFLDRHGIEYDVRYV